MTTKISDPVPLWWDLLTRLENIVGFGDAVIAGGAVRDFLLNRPFKDIDVFLPAGSFSEPTLEEIQASIVKALGPSAFVTRTNVVSYGGWLSRHSDPSLVATITVTWRGVTVQVILLSLKPDPLDVFEVLERVDFGICQCAYARKIPGHENSPEIIVTDAWIKDYQGKTFTLLRADTSDQREYSLLRYERITKGRYDDWKFVDGTVGG